MRVDLVIQSDATETGTWIDMSRALLMRGQQSGTFSLLMQADQRTDGAPGRDIFLSLCTLAADCREVMSIVFSAIESAGSRSGAAFTVRAPDGSQLMPGRLLDDFLAHAATHIAEAAAREDDGDISAAEDVRRLFSRVTGRAHPTVVRYRSTAQPPCYVLSSADGTAMLAMTSPIGRGWLVIERAPGREVRNMWMTAPNHVQFSICLQAEHFLADIAGPLDLVFSHTRVNAASDIFRHHFSSAIGPLVIHTREAGAGQGRVQLVAEIPQRGEIRDYNYARGTLPKAHTLVSAVPF